MIIGNLFHKHNIHDYKEITTFIDFFFGCAASVAHVFSEIEILTLRNDYNNKRPLDEIY